MTHTRRIGILTGGGDCPGLNAVIRAVTKDALFHGIEVMGIEDGFLGLIEDRVRPIDYNRASNILTRGGTILGASNKANPSRMAVGTDERGNVIYKDLTDACMATLETYGIDTMVVVGGDGTMTCAAPFVELGIRVIGVPKTIDNDLWGTELTFGHQTAVEIATEALDRVHTTAASHHRAMVVEVMGRNAGWIALAAGIASGADIILLPEIPFDIERVCEHVEQRSTRGRRFTIVCCSEGARPADGRQFVERHDPTSPDPIRLGGIAKWVSDGIERRTRVESRHVVLGHVQRGGTPVAGDRVLATLFGDHAMELLKGGRTNRMVSWRSGALDDVDIRHASRGQRLVPMDDPLIAAARSVYTSFGDGLAPGSGA